MTDYATSSESTSGSTHIRQGLMPTPFFARLDPLSRAKSWGNWAGFYSATRFEFVEKEYFAVRNSATLFDLSPMCKYHIHGPDAERVLNRLVTRNVQKLKPGRVGYTMWCDEEGMVIDDGTIFRHGDNEFWLLCQEHMLGWLHDTAWGFDVSIKDESKGVCGLSLQGPTSFSVLKDAGLGALSDMKPFYLREAEPGLWVSRTGYTGDLGYELFVRAENALALWDRLWEAGKLWGLTPMGSVALDLVRLEAGFLAPGKDFQPVQLVERLGRGRTPFELGFGKLVHFNKGHFNGRRALLAHKEKGPRTRLIKLDIEGRTPAQNAYVYAGRSKKVGFITSAAWSPTAKRNIALAEVDGAYSGENADGLWVEIDLYREGKWLRRQAKATIVDGAFLQIPRARTTPPGPF